MSSPTSHKASARWPVYLAVVACLVTLGIIGTAAWHFLLGPQAEESRDEAPEALRGIHYDPPREAPELEGLDYNGKPYTLHRQPHPLQMVFFGYVSCTDVCPTNLKKFEKIQKALGDKADQIQFVFVTIDPNNERPDTMKKYLAEYDGEIIGVTGEDDDDLEEVYDEWGIVRRRVELDEPVAGRDYKFDHSGQIFLVQDGDQIPVSYPYGTKVDTMTEDLEALIDDPSLGERLPEVGEVREVVLEAGTYTRAKQDNPTLPSYLRIREGDTIRWKNEDYMYHFIGDISLAPGDEATQKFDEAGEFYFGCTAVPSEVIRIKVAPDDQK
ncbi:MAG: SCO family protein [Persicimonas sp.]